MFEAGSSIKYIIRRAVKDISFTLVRLYPLQAADKRRQSVWRVSSVVPPEVCFVVVVFPVHAQKDNRVAPHKIGQLERQGAGTSPPMEDGSFLRHCEIVAPQKEMVEAIFPVSGIPAQFYSFRIENVSASAGKKKSILPHENNRIEYAANPVDADGQKIRQQRQVVIFEGRTRRQNEAGRIFKTPVPLD